MLILLCDKVVQLENEWMVVCLFMYFTKMLLLNMWDDLKYDFMDDLRYYFIMNCLKMLPSVVVLYPAVPPVVIGVDSDCVLLWFPV